MAVFKTEVQNKGMHLHNGKKNLLVTVFHPYKSVTVTCANIIMMIYARRKEIGKLI